MAGSYGAGRFLPQDFESYQAPDPFSAQNVTPGVPGMAYQPNYSLFWDPRAMLELGSPQFSAPWYNQTGAQTPQATPLPPQAQGLLGGVQIPSLYQGMLSPARAEMAGLSTERLQQLADVRRPGKVVNQMVNRNILFRDPSFMQDPSG